MNVTTTTTATKAILNYILKATACCSMMKLKYKHNLVNYIYLQRLYDNFILIIVLHNTVSSAKYIL